MREQPVRAEQLLRIPEVAARLSIHRTSAYDLIKTQRLPVHNIGTGKTPRLRVSETDLAVYIESTRIAPLKPRSRA